MGSRRKAREAVLKALYLSEGRNISIDEAFHEMAEIDRLIAMSVEESEVSELKPFALGLNEQQMEFARTLAHCIVDSREQLSEQIKPVLKNWDFSRISRIDRFIMWIALAEMQYMPDIPIPVSINEAIELAKKYSSQQSSSFVNGILDAIAKKMKPTIPLNSPMGDL